ncbi:MAG: Calx-beta domain-containing protein [Tenuifilaceae bacterium]|nr:Calx-beta domain-containing protein [Tenuifilaceae bacterium]
MRKILSLLTISLLVFFTSCDMNTAPEFDDSDAFVAFDNAAMSIAEDGGVIKIPVTVASVKGISTTANFELVDGTAKLGENFTLASESNTLTFDATNRTQFIEINVIKVDGFTGDLRFQVVLSEDSKVKPGVESACQVTIVDLDHPLAAILGTWNATAESAFNGEESWEMEFEKDEDDITVVWIYPFVKGGTSEAIYGVVQYDEEDEDLMTEIRIPRGQEIATSSSYGLIQLLTWDDGLVTSGNIIVEIDLENEVLTIKDPFGSYVWQNADGTGGLGWYNRFLAGGVLTR